MINQLILVHSSFVLHAVALVLEDSQWFYFESNKLAIYYSLKHVIVFLVCVHRWNSAARCL